MFFALQGDDRIELINFRAGPLAFKTQNTERLRIESNGRIAIGGFSGATHDLHIKTASSPSIKLEDTTQTTILQLYAQNSNAHVGTHSQHDLILNTNTTERLRIRAAGTHLLIGTGGDATYNEITESSSNAGLVIGSSSMGNGGIVIRNSTSGTGRIYFADNSVVILADKEVRSIIITMAII